MGHEPGTTFDVADGAMFGRADGADIRVEDPFASSSHARIYNRGGAMYLEDMGSTNGTHLNGRKVQVRRAAPHGRHDPHRRQRIPLRGVARWRFASSSRPAAPTWAASGPRTRTRSPSARRCSRSRTAWAARKAGEVASAVAVEAVERARESGEPAEAQLAGIVRDANRRIYDLAVADESRRGMGTTLTLAKVHGDEVSLAPRGRQPRVPHARRRARAAHPRPLARRGARAERPDHAGGRRAPPAALDHHARARPRAGRGGGHLHAGRPRGRRLPDLLGRPHVDDLGRRGHLDPAVRAVAGRRGRGARPGREPERRQGQHHGDPVPARRGRCRRGGGHDRAGARGRRDDRRRPPRRRHPGRGGGGGAGRRRRRTRPSSTGARSRSSRVEPRPAPARRGLGAAADALGSASRSGWCCWRPWSAASTWRAARSTSSARTTAGS